MCVAKPQREAGPDFRQAPDGSQDFPAECNHVVNKSDRALVEMLGGQVTDEHRCAQYCESLLGGSLEHGKVRCAKFAVASFSAGAKQVQLDQLVEFITSKQCAWIS